MVYALRPIYEPVFQVPIDFSYCYNHSSIRQQHISAIYRLGGGRDYILSSHRLMVWTYGRQHSRPTGGNL